MYDFGYGEWFKKVFKEHKKTIEFQQKFMWQGNKSNILKKGLHSIEVLITKSIVHYSFKNKACFRNQWLF